jgi:hypothetical protein
MVGNKLIYSDHWVSVRAKNEWEAKNKARVKFAYQLKHEEPVFFFSTLGIRNIMTDLDIADMEVYNNATK